MISIRILGFAIYSFVALAMVGGIVDHVHADELSYRNLAAEPIHNGTRTLFHGTVVNPGATDLHQQELVVELLKNDVVVETLVFPINRLEAQSATRVMRMVNVVADGYRVRQGVDEVTNALSTVIRN